MRQRTTVVSQEVDSQATDLQCQRCWWRAEMQETCKKGREETEKGCCYRKRRDSSHSPRILVERNFKLHLRLITRLGGGHERVWPCINGHSRGVTMHSPSSNSRTEEREETREERRDI